MGLPKLPQGERKNHLKTFQITQSMHLDITARAESLGISQGTYLRDLVERDLTPANDETSVSDVVVPNERD